MTLKDIALFKAFIANKDLRKPFIRVYNRSKKWAKLPDSIEQYFSNVDPLAVVTKAARICKPNDVYGYDFWQDINEDWKLYYKKTQSSHFYEEVLGLEELAGFYKILRENWNDAEKPWRYEELADAQARLGLPLTGPAENKQAPAVEPEPAEEESDDLEIDFVEFKKSYHRVSSSLQRGIISVNIRNKSWRVTINREDTKDLVKKGVKNVMVGKTKNGDIMMQFNNNEKGLPITYNSDKYYNINSRQFVERLRELITIDGELEYLRIEKVAEKIDSITYKITKQQ
jgi:hypothetical protein